MQVENHKEEVPFAHYQQRFMEADGAEIAQRTGVALENGEFSVTLLGKDYHISCPAGEVSPQAPLPLQTFLLRWLLEGRQAPTYTEFKTFREMPWGEVYIKPFTGRILTRAAFTFGTRIGAFRQAAERLGGAPLPHGDAGYEFTLLEGYSLRLLVWEGDEEFPPNAQVLYSDNFAEAFAAEDRVVAGELLIGALKSAM